MIAINCDQRNRRISQQSFNWWKKRQAVLGLSEVRGLRWPKTSENRFLRAQTPSRAA
jgi:hypothetical protein